MGASECRNSLAIYESRIAGHQSIIYRNGAADFELNFADVEAIDLSAYGAVIATGTALTVEPSRGAAFRIFERAKNASIPVILDIDYRPYSWPSRDAASQNLERAAKCADVIIGNDEEFEFLAGLHEGGLEHRATSCADDCRGCRLQAGAPRRDHVYRFHGVSDGYFQSGCAQADRSG